jgi:hypothetical protein
MPTAPSLWEHPFYMSQLAAVIVWIVALATVRLQRRVSWLRPVALGFAVLTELALPAAWNAIDPASGLAALRGVPAFAGACVEAALSCIWAAASAADVVAPRLLAAASAGAEDVPRRPSTLPFVVVGVLGVALWVAWTCG